MDNTKFQVDVKVFLNEDLLLEESTEFNSHGSTNHVKIILSVPVKIKPNRRYDITTEITGGPTLYGRNAKKVVHSEVVSLR